MAGIPSSFVRGPADIITLRDDDLLADALRQLLGTRGGDKTQIGELPWRGDFGCRLDRLIHLPRDTDLQSLAFSLVREAVTKWLPAIIVQGVGTRFETIDDSEALVITVQYKNRFTNNVRTVTTTF